MMVNCFACGKDIGVSTERRSFSSERPSESKVRVLHAWRSMVQEELSLSGHRIESIDHLFQPYTNKMCRSCFESYKRIDKLDAMLRNNIRIKLFPYPVGRTAKTSLPVMKASN